MGAFIRIEEADIDPDSVDAMTQHEGDQSGKRITTLHLRGGARISVKHTRENLDQIHRIRLHKADSEVLGDPDQEAL